MLDISNLIQQAGSFGYIVVFVIIFLESFPFTFYLPGDSLLFTVGFLSSGGYFNIGIMILLLFISGTSGYICSYFLGKWVEKMIYSEVDTFWFRRKHFLKTKEFYEKYGAKTLIIGRFVPIVRSFAPALAGAVNMDFKKFLKYSILGGILWACGVTMVGYYLGNMFPEAQKYLTPMIIFIVIISLIPAVFEYIKEKNKIKKNG